MSIDDLFAPKEYGFTINDVGDALVLTTREAILAGGELTPLWQHDFEWRAERYAMGAWVAARRHLWDHWGRLAQAEGPELLEAHIWKLWWQTPPAQPSEVVLGKGEDPREVYVHVRFGNGFSRLVAEHRFLSGRARTRFLRRLESNSMVWELWDLVETAWLEGPRVFAACADLVAGPRMPGADPSLTPRIVGPARVVANGAAAASLSPSPN